MADFQIVAGDTLPQWNDTLTYSTGAIAEPESVTLVLRNPAAEEPLTLTGTASVVSKAKGEVRFAPSAADTATPGVYMASWKAKIAGATMTFPTQGYLWVEIQPSLSAKSPGKLVALPEVKDHLFIPAHDHTHDDTLVRMIEAAAPLIENLTGPILPRVYNEWYEGGHVAISLSQMPSVGFGTTPILNVMAVSEYRGPIEYNISLVGTPTEGSVYSAMVDEQAGQIIRRTSGGGTTRWWRDPNHPKQSVHVVYQSGQQIVPGNVRHATLETIRSWFEMTQMVGRGALAAADEPVPSGVQFHALPPKAETMLAPTRRPPALA